jgi:hypothetical protein
MTLYILESGITKASEVTREFFNRTRFFFVRMNLVENTIEFINANFPEDMLTINSIKEFKQADNGYMKITTQDSVINITPACCPNSEKGIEEFIEEITYIIAKWNIQGEAIDADELEYLPSHCYTVSDNIKEDWVEKTTYLYKTEKGIIIAEDIQRWKGEQVTYFETITFYPIKIGGEIRKTKRINISFATD